MADPYVPFTAGGSPSSTTTDPSAVTLYEASPAVRKQIATLLKNAGYRVSVDGKYSDALLNAYRDAVQKAAIQSQVLGRSFTVKDYLQQEAQAPSSAGGGPSITNYISDPTQAAATIQGVFQDVLAREASDKEVQALTKILVDAQKRNPYKTVDGVRTGGLDDKQFLLDLIRTGTYEANKKAYPGTLKKLSEELAKKKTEAEALKAGKEEGAAFDAKTKLKSVAIANGLTLSDAQLDNYVNQVKAGKDIGILEQGIRDMAGLGMPDSIKKRLSEGTDLETIYGPYRQRMASVLEVPYDQISLEDSALRSAIGPDKEMPLYEFEKALRKDNRWQYTDNARQTVSDAALRVLRDFGFQG